MSFTSIITVCEALLKNIMKSNDPSHDWLHVDRVKKLSKSIALQEQVNDATTLFVIEMGALLHDVNDWKFTDQTFDVLKWLDSAGVSDSTVADRILFIINYCGYRKQLQGCEEKVDIPLEAKIVRDADKLDAMGAIGIARAFTYGGNKKRSIYHPDRLDVVNRLQSSVPPTQEEYVAMHNDTSSQAPSTLDHFVDKLLRLLQSMETSTGKRLGTERHIFMITFVTVLRHEIENEK